MSKRKCKHGPCSDWHETCFWCPENERVLENWVFHDEKKFRLHVVEVRTLVFEVSDETGSQALLSREFRIKR
jgi:hypothetical protein